MYITHLSLHVSHHKFPFIEIDGVPSEVVGLIGRDVRINCDVVLGTSEQILEWYYTSVSGDDIKLWTSDKRRSYQSG